jgi:adenosylcobinamide kinase/adenosylcobinamide-phosphate guanylyltransferase
VRAEHSSVLILGGARSGKSRYAVERALAAGGRTAFVATAEALDDEMAERIERHRRERPDGWITIEEPLDLLQAVRGLADRAETLVIDCLTVWVANRLQQGTADHTLLAEAEELCDLIRKQSMTALIVSNEVGLGVHPETSMGLQFRDLLGSVNQRVAVASDHVIFMVSGIPLVIKQHSAISAHRFGGTPNHNMGAPSVEISEKSVGGDQHSANE